uniref:TauD/TfdA-like domain-containing protein n=1 Tax=Odontella aurita TaxID=265563 RepID=A0A7S4JR41_9STRA|mmetsp:Transcript_52077/g.156261  ORF Transcript_52077/g.156261 Transcript_52077/m.156261 type:complete len:317 (+) Transcript_52077:260-1210(+)
MLPLLSRNVHYEVLGPLHPPHFGAQIRGLDIRTAPLSDPALIRQLKSDLREHRLLLFRDHAPDAISGDRQVELSAALGRIESTFYRHPRSPHPDVFRVSNDEKEGCRNVGRSGWHVDGTFLRTPFAYQTMHFPSTSEGGDTLFVPLRELYDSRDEETRERWGKLWMMTGGRGRGSPVHPLVYRHPYRGDATMCFHCGEPFVSGWLLDDRGALGRSSAERGKNGVELCEVLSPGIVREELAAAIESSSPDLVCRMKWRTGDLAVVDNLGLAHLAVPETQASKVRAGLRVLHRTTVLGERDDGDTIPTKEDGSRTFLM